MNKEITLQEISCLIGVSENQLLKNWKRYSIRLDELGISKEGRGQKAKYFVTKSDEDNLYKLAYSTLQDILEMKDIKNILKFLEIVICNKDNFYTNKDYSELVGVSERAIKGYRKLLRDLEIILPNEYCHQKYYAVNRHGEHIEISQDEYTNIEKAITNEQIKIYETDTDKRLFEANNKLRGHILKEFSYTTMYSVPRLELSHRIQNSFIELGLLCNAIVYSNGTYRHSVI